MQAPIAAAIHAQAEQVTNGLGAAMDWPGMLRNLERRE